MKKNDPIAFLDPRGERRLGYFGEESYLGLVWVAAKKGGTSGWWVRQEQIVDKPSAKERK